MRNLDRAEQGKLTGQGRRRKIRALQEVIRRFESAQDVGELARKVENKNPVEEPKDLELSLEEFYEMVYKAEHGGEPAQAEQYGQMRATVEQQVHLTNAEWEEKLDKDKTKETKKELNSKNR